jgi:hypothetical protein
MRTRSTDNMSLKEAMRLSRLWYVGKMIGGDSDAARDTLYEEVLRLQADARRYQYLRREHVDFVVQQSSPKIWKACHGPMQSTAQLSATLSTRKWATANKS